MLDLFKDLMAMPLSFSLLSFLCLCVGVREHFLEKGVFIFGLGELLINSVPNQMLKNVFGILHFHPILCVGVSASVLLTNVLLLFG